VERALTFVMLDVAMDDNASGQHSSRGRDDDYSHERPRFVVPLPVARPADRAAHEEHTTRSWWPWMEMSSVSRSRTSSPVD